MLSLLTPSEKHRFPKGICMSISRSSAFGLDLSAALPDGLILITVLSPHLSKAGAAGQVTILQLSLCLEGEAEN